MAKSKSVPKTAKARQAADKSNATTEKEETKGKHMKGKKTPKVIISPALRWLARPDGLPSLEANLEVIRN